MRMLLLAGLVVGGAGTAHAMGSDWTYDLLAWNADGSAALLHRATSRDGDHSDGYYLVSVVASQHASAELSATTREDAKDVQQIDRAHCVVAARTLARALAAARFRDVAVREDRCATARDQVVQVGADAARDAAQSWVALPQGRDPTPREAKAWNLIHAIAPAYVPFVPGTDETCASQHDTLDVADRTGKLVLVFTSWTCNSPIRVTVTGYAPGKTGLEDAHVWGANP